jgi:hypothetical protein
MVLFRELWPKLIHKIYSRRSNESQKFLSARLEEEEEEEAETADS